jgi:hypothetical protein
LIIPLPLKVKGERERVKGERVRVKGEGQGLKGKGQGLKGKYAPFPPSPFTLYLKRVRTSRVK